MGISFNWESESSSKTEISELDCSLSVNKQVLGLQVSVHDSVGVAVGS